jgi:hypothetical protein
MSYYFTSFVVFNFNISKKIFFKKSNNAHGLDPICGQGLKVLTHPGK